MNDVSCNMIHKIDIVIYYLSVCQLHVKRICESQHIFFRTACDVYESTSVAKGGGLLGTCPPRIRMFKLSWLKQS